MKTRCPSCGATVSLDALIAHDGAREALMAAFRLSGPLGAALVRYLSLFRPDTRELSMERVGKLLGEIVPDMQAGRITRNGQVFDAPREAWQWAMEQALLARDSGRLKTPLKSHGWLYEVITSYRPAAVVLEAAPGMAHGKAASKTLTGLKALEAFKHGECTHGR